MLRERLGPRRNRAASRACQSPRSGREGIVTVSPASRPARAAATRSLASMIISDGICPISAPVRSKKSVRVAPGSTAWNRTPLPAEFGPEPLRQCQDEGLAGRVGGVEALRDDGDGGGDVDNRARSSVAKSRRRREGQGLQRPDVEFEQPVIEAGRAVESGAKRSETGAVHEDAQGGIRGDAVPDHGKILRSGQVGRHDLDSHAALSAETLRRRPQPGLVAGDEDEVMASSSQLVGVSRADSRGGARYERRAGVLGHRGILVRRRRAWCWRPVARGSAGR